MLKIKDNVDLKELEKYGFELNEYINDLNIKEWNNILHLDENNNIREEIPPLNRNEINWVFYDKGNYFGKNLSINVIDKTSDGIRLREREIYNDEVDFDTLYDLIKADLVEKVDDTNENI